MATKTTPGLLQDIIEKLRKELKSVEGNLRYAEGYQAGELAAYVTGVYVSWFLSPRSHLHKTQEVMELDREDAEARLEEMITEDSGIWPDESHPFYGFCNHFHNAADFEQIYDTLKGRLDAEYS